MTSAATEGAPFPTAIAVVGLGLIGGSLVRSFARLPSRPRVMGSSVDARDREGAERVPGVSVHEDGAEIVEKADLVIYAVPLGATVELIGAHADRIRADAVVTDVAGLKRPVLDAARRAGLGDRFVGSHPMAGGEGSGFAAGRADLFEGARVWLCADPAAARHPLRRLAEFWAGLGARPETVDAAEHDRLMVRVSHLPQLVSNALALALEEAGVAPADLGPGGRDMTRLAGSSPAMWADLLAHAGGDAAGLLRAVAAHVEGLAEDLEAKRIDAVSAAMKRTRAWREQT